MHCRILIAALCALFTALPIAGQEAWSIQIGTNNQALFKIDLSDGSRESVSPLGGLVDIQAMARRPGADHFLLYGRTENNIFSLIRYDASIPVLEEIVPFRVDQFRDMTFAPDGRLLGSIDNEIFEIDPTTGQQTFLGAFGRELWGIEMIGGRLYGVLGSGRDYDLYELDLTTGQATFAAAILKNPSGSDLARIILDTDLEGRLYTLALNRTFVISTPPTYLSATRIDLATGDSELLFETRVAPFFSFDGFELVDSGLSIAVPATGAGGQIALALLLAATGALWLRLRR
ncbi:MAG: hypothetical protein AAGM22_33745 [Acidobacteriota bacterium]